MGNSTVLENRLQRSRLILCAAVILLLAPIGNFLFSIAMLGLLRSSGELWWYALRSISSKDLVVSGLLFFSGLLLLRRHRYSWLLAVTILFGISLLNLAYYLGWISRYASHAQQTQLWISLLTTLLGFTTISYLTYPFIDRRYGLLSNDERFDVNLEALIDSHGLQIPVRVVSISRSGARLEVVNQAENIAVTNMLSGVLKLPEIGERSFDFVHQDGSVLRIKWHRRLWRLSPWLQQKGSR